MNTIKSFNKQTLPALNFALQKALNQVAQEFGLDRMSFGNMTFTPDGGEVNCTLTAKVDPAHNSAVRDTHKRISMEMGYNQNIVGHLCVQVGEVFRITGFDLRKKKFPIEAVAVVGNRRVSLQNVKGGLSFQLKTITWANPNGVHHGA